MTPPRENPLLLGQEAAEARLLEALNGGRMHHAWLLTGPDGVGKATLAFRLARRLLAGPGPGEQWDTLALDAAHPVFRRVAAATHADLLTVEREWDDKKRRVKKQIAAEDVRRIGPFLRLTPAEGGWRVVVVDGAEDLSIQSANALLKILEEPPPRAVLVLCCSAPGRLLPTLRSRCRALRLERLAPPVMAALLPQLLPGAGEAEREGLARLARGSPGRAVALAAEDGLAAAALAGEVLAALPGWRASRSHAVADRLARTEGGFEAFLDLLRDAVADAARASLRGTADAAQARLVSVLGGGAAREGQGRGQGGAARPDAAGPPSAAAEDAPSGPSPGTADAAPLAALGELWEALGRLQAETEGLNLDKRQAVVSALALLAATAGGRPGASHSPNHSPTGARRA